MGKEFQFSSFCHTRNHGQGFYVAKSTICNILIEIFIAELSLKICPSNFPLNKMPHSLTKRMAQTDTSVILVLVLRSFSCNNMYIYIDLSLVLVPAHHFVHLHQTFTCTSTGIPDYASYLYHSRYTAVSSDEQNVSSLLWNLNRYKLWGSINRFFSQLLLLQTGKRKLTEFLASILLLELGYVADTQEIVIFGVLKLKCYSEIAIKHNSNIRSNSSLLYSWMLVNVLLFSVFSQFSASFQTVSSRKILKKITKSKQ